MNKVIVLRFGELYLKGKNRSYFEKVLINNIKKSLNEFNGFFPLLFVFFAVYFF